MTANIDFDNLEDGAPEDEAEESLPKRRNPLRLVLLVILILVVLCVACYGGSRLFSGVLVGIVPSQIQGMLPQGVISALETPAPGATEELPVPPPGEQPAEQPAQPATEQPAEQPVTEQPAEQPVAEQPVAEQPTEQPVAEQPAEQPVTEQPAEGVPTVEAVPGPTATPMPGEVAPTVVITTAGCEANQPPVAEANGPYNGMMGKGEAFINFDAIGSIDPDEAALKYQWEFGDGSAPGEGEKVTHGYKNIGQYVVILTVTDNCNATGQDTTEVTIVGPTPPPPGSTPTPAPSSTPLPTSTPAPQSQATMGFCYLVQYGDTLSGIAWYYGLPVADLAALNGVSADYYVVAGQGLFIPMGPITSGPYAFSAQAGDTINSIAYQCGLTPAAVAEANNLDVNADLQPGQVIIIPPAQ